ncbi:hypothetical protein HK098_000183 [Nowakowskiella sp. JEL0407]|nr:hypothetical protein HK098_000183 [Nowakowskiella sp. JEL0407]
MKQHIDEKEAFEKECQEIISSTAESLSKLRSATQLEPQESYYAALSKFGLEPEPTNPMLAPAAESNQRTNPLTLHEDDDRESTISAERSVASTINKKKSQMFSPISIDAFERIPTLVRGKIVTIESINKLYRTFWDHFNKSTNNPGDVMSVPKMVQLGLKINSKTGQSHLQTLEALGFIQIMSDKSIRWVR